MLRNRPTELPPEAVTTVVGLLRHQMPELAYGVHCVEEVVSFGLGQVLPDPPPLSAPKAQTPVSHRHAQPDLSDEDIASHLERLTAARSPGAVAALNVPWGAVLKRLIPLLLELLASQGA